MLPLFLSLCRYNYNSQAVPEPDEFNAVDFDPAKFVEQQTQCKQRQSLVVENNGTLKYTQTTTTTTKNTALPNGNIAIAKPKRFRSDTNLLPASSPPSFPFLAPSPIPLWPFNLYHPSYIPAMMNAIRLSSMTNAAMPSVLEDKQHLNKPSRKSFEIEGILNLSLRDNKRKQLSDTPSSDEEDSL